MRRGQQEATFQWVFALLAGGVFFVMFFLAFKGCAETSTEATGTLGLKAAKEKLATMAWEPDTTTSMTLSQVAVTCPAGVITLSSQATQPQTLDYVPVFLPPFLDGKIVTVSKQLALVQEGTPSIPLGNALYAIDESVLYLVTDQAVFDTVQRVLGSHKTIVVVDEEPTSVKDYAVPSHIKTLVIVEEGIVLNSVPPQTTAKVYGIVVELDDVGSGGVIGFAKRTSAGHWENIDGQNPRMKYFDEYQLVGAIISGKKPTYACTRKVLVDRMRILTKIYEKRLKKMSGDNSFDPPDGLLKDCKPHVDKALGLLYLDGNYKGINEQTNDDSYLAALYNTNPVSSLMNYQSLLYGLNCPVIA